MREPIYKGATRPAVWMGIPMFPFMVVSGAALLLVMWGVNFFGSVVLIPVAVLYVPLMLWMRFVTVKDDQRLRQIALRVRLGAMVRTRVWSVARSYSLLPVRKSTRYRKTWEQ